MKGEMVVCPHCQKALIVGRDTFTVVTELVRDKQREIRAFNLETGAAICVKKTGRIQLRHAGCKNAPKPFAPLDEDNTHLLPLLDAYAIHHQLKAQGVT